MISYGQYKFPVFFPESNSSPLVKDTTKRAKNLIDLNKKALP